jgi:ATP synthase protein I
MEPPLSARPIRNVLKWQVLATLVLAAVGGAFAGVHGALSAALGGIVNLSACVVYGVMLGRGRPATPGATIATMVRAEASKILVIVLQLWLVLAHYKDIVLLTFFAAFVITVLLFRMALFVRD